MKYEFFAHIGIRNKTLPIPFFIIKGMVLKKAKKIAAHRFSREIRRIQHFVVRQMPISGMPLSLEYLAQALEMSRQKVQTIVEDLEKRKTFMYRYNSEAINWAYPVTVDKTPHHITFSTGEEVNAA